MQRARLIALVLLVPLVAAAVLFWHLLSQLGEVDWGNALVESIREQSQPVGLVQDKDGPVAGARVRFKGDEKSVLTDDEGRFRLPSRHGDPLSRITAWKDGYFIGGIPWTPIAAIPLIRLPTEDCERYAWVDPTPDPSGKHNCGNCHGEIYREWAGSAHARSASGRRFRNLYDGTDWDGKPGAGWGLLEQYPDGAGVCTACHAPTVRPEDAAYYDLRKARGVAALGVHCDYCHKIADAGLGKIGLTHGRFGTKLLRPAEGQLFFGPLDDVDRGEDAYSPLYRESRYCASCHEGTVLGVHVYSTYSEWLQSPAREEGKQCQDCHMKPTGKLTNFAPGKGGIERDPWTLGNHRFFDRSLEEMLRDCLRLAVDLTPLNDMTRATITLEADRVGHRVPTGFIDRHLLLIVDGMDADGKTIPLVNGPTLPPVAGKDLSERPGVLLGRLLKDLDGRAPAPFWKADPAFVDTRLAPGQPQIHRFFFPAELDRVRVRLIYRPFWQEVARSKRWPDSEITVIDRTARVPQS